MTQASFGYGQMTSEDLGSDANATAFMVRMILSKVATMKMVKVTAVHSGSGTPPATGTVDVIPLVNQMDGEGFNVRHTTVMGLRFLRLQAGPWQIVADPVVGDIGIIVCADRDSSNVKGGDQVTPGSRRRYNIADGIYIGGILGSSPSAYLQLKSDGTLKIADKSGNLLESSSQGWALTGNLNVTGTIMSSGLITGADFSDGSVTSYKVHTHSGVTTGVGTSGPPVPGT